MNPLTLVAAVVVALILICIGQAVALIRQHITISDLRDTVTAYSIISNKKGNTIDEQAQMLVEMNDRNERLHEDNRRMRERLPALAFDEDVTRPYIPEWERQFLEDPEGFRKTYRAQP